MRTVNKKTAAFTIIELMVVVAILATLVGLLVPALAKMKEQARAGATRAVINTIEGGLDLYYSDHKIYPLSGPTTSVKGGSGATNLVVCMTGSPEYGKGFQMTFRGPFYGPYGGTEKLGSRRLDPKDQNSSPVFIDSWNRPVLYYAFDSSLSRGDPAKYYDDNSDLVGTYKDVVPAVDIPSNINNYAINAGGSYLDRRYLLLSPGPNGFYSPQSTAPGSDDITNLRSE